MPTVNDDLARLQDDLLRKEARITKLEAELEQVKRKGKDAWDIFQSLSQSLSPFVTGVVLAIVGYFLTGAVNVALQQQQMQLSNVKEMKELLEKLGTTDITAEQAEASAFTLSVFGRYAIAPLIDLVLVGGEVRGPAAEKGLRAVGLREPTAVCDQLAHLLDTRSAWQTHRVVIRLLGDLRCQQALPTLQAYAQLVEQAATPEGLRRYKNIVQDDPQPTAESIELLKQELDRTSRFLAPPAR